MDTPMLLVILCVISVLLCTVASAGVSESVGDSSLCATPIYWSGYRNVTLNVNGDDRVVALFIPWNDRGKTQQCGSNLTPQTYCTGPPLDPAPLVVNWHGCNAHGPIIDYHTEISQMNHQGADRNYIIMTPLGTMQPGSVEGNYGWNADGIPCGSRGTNDFQFFEAMLDFAQESLCVDMNRVYSVGFSTGAFLSYGIACRYPDRVSGIAADAGGLSKEYYKACLNSGSGPVPVQSFHSLADPTVPYDGNIDWVGQKEMDDLWKKKNGCADDDEGTISYNTSTTVCTYYDCPLAPVEACVLQDIDHCWYGGRSGGFQACQPRPGDVDATKKMFDFWEKNNKNTLERLKRRKPLKTAKIQMPSNINS